jgi:hypothetical protein
MSSLAKPLFLNLYVMNTLVTKIKIASGKNVNVIERTADDIELFLKNHLYQMKTQNNI